MRNLYSASGNGEIDKRKLNPIDTRDIRSLPLHELMVYSSVSQAYIKGMVLLPKGRFPCPLKVHENSYSIVS